ncbi:hypothetical protein LADH09A_003680 [Micromonospora sp. LAH09]|uniref:hypothetical protein n=1 Tax=Micromonospora cabrerizensis TaxID=2911213 RepID=UPI001EE7F014|nr:hypothetical protein [Micromonospora cabrerizensis]MCG5469758.1 hypothetical protein [Micromonospora cabrerizensis]
MAFRTWGRLLLTALGVSVLAGAGQLGVAYGFGIVRLTGAFTGTTVNQWPTQLVWVGWFAANAAVAGAVLTGRLARRDAPAVSTGRQLAIGGAAALGATVIAPLCMQPARAAELISVDPVWAVGICAVLGAVIGAGAAIAVLLRPELGWNMAAVAGVVWLLALISVLPSLGTTGPLPTVRLGVLEPSWLADDAAQRLSLLLLPIVALLAGVATAGLARWRGQAPLISGATGVAGPVLVAFAYLTAGPGDAVDRYQATPYYGSLIAILAGALGAAAAALLRWPVGARNADPQAIEPSDILRPLPPGPALPGSASANPTNDPDTTDRSDAQPPADATPAGGVVAGPWAAAGSDGVRTAPAHWDWPASTTGGHDGPAPAVPAKPAAWLTDPTGEFTAGAQTRRPVPDDVTSVAGTERSAATGVSSPTDAAPASARAGRAGAAAPTAGPTDSATPTSATSTATTGAGKAGADTTSTSAAGTISTGTTATGATSTGTISTGTTDAGAASTGTTSTGTTATDAASTGATSTGTTDAGTGDAAAPPKPRRVRKPKVSPGAAISDSADDASPSESDVADDAATGRGRKVTRAGRPADSTGSGTTTDTPVRSRESQDTGSERTTEAAPTAATGSKAAPAAVVGSTGAPAAAKAESVNPPRTRAATAGTEAANPTAEAVPSSRVPAAAPSPKAGGPDPKTGAASPEAETPDPKADATKPPRATAAASSAEAKAADLPRSEATATSSKAEAANPPRTPADPPRTPADPPRTPANPPRTPANPPRTPATAASPKARKGDPASASATERAGGADDAAPAATEDGAGLFGSTAAGEPDTDRWTPAPSAWPVSAAWTVPPQATAPGPATPETPTGSDKPTGPTPRPRHRAPLPDLSRASTWNAFDTTRRAGQAESADSSAARTTPTSPAAAGETAARPGSPSRTDAPVMPGTAGTPTEAATATATGTGTDESAKTGTDESASTDATPAASKPGKVAEQPSRRGRLGGLFRRNRSRADEESPESADDVEPLPAQDEEFVDWVAGLSKPVSDNEPEQENGRRSLRSTGRHHRE